MNSLRKHSQFVTAYIPSKIDVRVVRLIVNLWPYEGSGGYIQSELGGIGRFQLTGTNTLRYIIGDIKGIKLFINLIRPLTPAFIQDGYPS